MNYNQIGFGYNQTRRADPFLAETLYSLLASSSPQSTPYLDIGCGTGNYTVELAQRGLNMTGVEPAELMLERARQHKTPVNWLRGQAEAIPLADESVAGAVASLTIHHWENLEAGFAEMYRVVAPGGRWVLFTSFPAQMQQYWLNHYFPEMMQRSCATMPQQTQVEQAAQKAGWRLAQRVNYAVQPDLQDHFLYIGKHDPERYFDPVIRQGISSFRMEGLEEEVETGLAALRQDIDRGHWQKVVAQYDGSAGDYCFLVWEK